MESPLKHMKSITNKLAAIKAPVSEAYQVVILLGSLLESYDTIVAALEARGDALILEFAQNALLNEEQKKSGEQRLPGKTGVSGSVRHPASTNTALSANINVSVITVDRSSILSETVLCLNRDMVGSMVRDLVVAMASNTHTAKYVIEASSKGAEDEEYGFAAGANPELIQE